MTRPDPMLTHTIAAGVVLSAVAWLVGGAAVGVASIVGATFALANVVALRYVVRRLLSAQRTGALITFKLAASVAIVFVLQRTLGVHPVGLAIGYGALVIGVLTAPNGAALLTLRDTET